MAWQLELSSSAMPWHTCHSLSTELCFFSSPLFSLLFFSLICSLQQFSSSKISFPYIFPPSSFAFFTYLFLFSYLKWQHMAQETGLQPAFKSLFNPLSEISSTWGGQSKQSVPRGTPSLLCQPTAPEPSCSAAQCGSKDERQVALPKVSIASVKLRLYKNTETKLLLCCYLSWAMLPFPLFQMRFLKVSIIKRFSLKLWNICHSQTWLSTFYSQKSQLSLLTSSSN